MTSSSFTNLQLVQGSTSSTLTNGAAVTTLALPDSNEKTQLYLSKSSGASRLSLAYSTSSSPNLTLIGYATDYIDNIQTNDILSMQNGVSVSNGIVFSIVGSNTGTTGSPQSWTVPTGSGLTLLASGAQAAFYYSTNSSIPTTTVGNLTLNWVQSQSGYFASATSVLYIPVPTIAQTLTTVESDIAAKTNSQWLNSANSILINEIDNTVSTGYTQLTSANTTTLKELDNSSLVSSTAVTTGQAVTSSANFTSSILSKANVLLNSISKSISVLTASVAESKAEVSAPMPVVYSDQTAAVQSLSSSSGKTITLTENVLPPAISAKANLSSNAISTSFSTKVNNIRFLAIMSSLAIKAKIRLVNPPKQLVKSIYIKAIGTVSHAQTYNSDNWFLPNDQDATDFAITDEVEEFVPPMSTTYDYALDDDQDPVDFNITEGY